MRYSLLARSGLASSSEIPLLVGVCLFCAGCLNTSNLCGNNKAAIATLSHAVRDYGMKYAFVANAASGYHYCDTNATRSLARNPPGVLAPISASPKTASRLKGSISLRPEANLPIQRGLAVIHLNAP